MHPLLPSHSHYQEAPSSLSQSDSTAAVTAAAVIAAVTAAVTACGNRITAAYGTCDTTTADECNSRVLRI